MNHQPAQRPNRVTAIFEHTRIAFDMARGVTLAQLAGQLATLAAAPDFWTGGIS